MEYNGTLGFKVYILMDTPVGLAKEEFSGIIHPTRQDARNEITDALYNPQYAGYEFDIEDVWM